MPTQTQVPLVSNPIYSYPFPSSHRFPMEKFGLLAQYISEQGWLQASNTFRPGKAKQEVLELAHCSHYLHRFIHNKLSTKEVRRMGLPWSEGLVNRTLVSPNGTLLTANLALRHGIACHLAGGTHHAHYDFASGFCILNDLAITAKALLAAKKINRILIFDCDVHQGDGTARMLEDEPSAFTCSIHCEKNFPARKAQSDLDINLPAGINDEEYLSALHQTLSEAVEQTQPDLILYDAGVDIYSNDPLGLMNVSEEGIRQRDQYVINFCKEASIPVATVIGGGYDNDRKALARRHAIVIEEAVRVFNTL